MTTSRVREQDRGEGGSVNEEPVPTKQEGDELPPPPCFIIHRHPIGRAISYYYQRLYFLKKKKFGDLSAFEVADMIKFARSGQKDEETGQVFITDEGLSDAVCSTLLARRNSTGLSMPAFEQQERLQRHEQEQGADGDTRKAHLDAARVISRARQCVVGLQERWNETLMVFMRWFPWAAADVDPMLRLMHAEGAETVADLRDDVKQVILEANPCDAVVFAAMESRFEEQLAAMRDLGPLLRTPNHSSKWS